MKKFELSNEDYSDFFNYDDNGLEGHIDNLHEIMLLWLNSDSHKKTDDYKYINTYNTIRCLLLKLRPLAKEQEKVFEIGRKQFEIDQKHRKQLLEKQKEASAKISKEMGGFFSPKG